MEHNHQGDQPQYEAHEHEHDFMIVLGSEGELSQPLRRVLACLTSHGGSSCSL